jgi:hypothetical protein
VDTEEDDEVCSIFMEPEGSHDTQVCFVIIHAILLDKKTRIEKMSA